MTFVEVNWNPESRQLRQFGLLCLVLLPMFSWFWNADPYVIVALGVVGGLMVVLAWFAPKVIRPIFIGSMLIAAPFGLVVGELATLAIYFGIFLPIGLAFRMIRRDALKLRIDRKSRSYWQVKQAPKDAASYYRRY